MMGKRSASLFSAYAESRALSTHAADAALDTLLLPFEAGALAWPDAPVLFLHARTNAALRKRAGGNLVCEQPFKPYADTLVNAGFEITTSPEGAYQRVLVLPPRQREFLRALLAQALKHATPGGIVVASMANNEGARSGEADLERLAGNIQSLSKNKCRVFWAMADPGAMNAALIDEWAMLDAPRRIESDFISRPGVFSWDRIDPASRLLAGLLPEDLAGRGADLGAGFGYLSAQVLSHCPGTASLDLYEADARALELARQNLQAFSARCALNFFWHDVTVGLPHRYDFIVSNPPFHLGRAAAPELGRAFIEAAARGLHPGGRLWLVANRHLPYEETLLRNFKTMRMVADEQGFKVIEAIKGSP